MDEEPKVPLLGNGITTRMLERRLTLELDMNKRNSLDLKEVNQGNSSGTNNVEYKFLQGVSMPNSVARKSLQPKIEENKTRRSSYNRSFSMPQENVIEEREKFNQNLTTSLKELHKIYLETIQPSQTSNISNGTSHDLWERMKTKRKIFDNLIPKMSTIEEKSVDTNFNSSPQRSIQANSLKTPIGSKSSSNGSTKSNPKTNKSTNNVDSKSNSSQECKDNVGPLKSFGKVSAKRKNSSGGSIRPKVTRRRKSSVTQ